MWLLEERRERAGEVSEPPGNKKEHRGALRTVARSRVTEEAEDKGKCKCHGQATDHEEWEHTLRFHQDSGLLYNGRRSRLTNYRVSRGKRIVLRKQVEATLSLGMKKDKTTIISEGPVKIFKKRDWVISFSSIRRTASLKFYL